MKIKYLDQKKKYLMKLIQKKTKNKIMKKILLKV